LRDGKDSFVASDPIAAKQRLRIFVHRGQTVHNRLVVSGGKSCGAGCNRYEDEYRGGGAHTM